MKYIHATVSDYTASEETITFTNDAKGYGKESIEGEGPCVEVVLAYYRIKYKFVVKNSQCSWTVRLKLE